MFTGNEFGHNSNITLTKWNTDWSPAISHPQNILSSINGDGNWFSTGIVYDGTNNLWIVAFQHIDQNTSINSEHIDIVIFDDNFFELSRAHVTSEQCFRPDLLLLDGYLFLTYDKSGSGVFIHKYLLQYPLSVLTEKNEKNNNPRLIRDMLGKSTINRINTPLFYIYNDGTVEKKIIIE